MVIMMDLIEEAIKSEEKTLVFRLFSVTPFELTFHYIVNEKNLCV